MRKHAEVLALGFAALALSPLRLAARRIASCDHCNLANMLVELITLFLITIIASEIGGGLWSPAEDDPDAGKHEH